MARIYPFRALRYNPSLVKLDEVVTQPYDKISPSMQQAYYRRSPFNLVRIILGLPELFDVEEHADVYTRAARDLRAWRKEGVLLREADPCVFAYSQRFMVPDSLLPAPDGASGVGTASGIAERQSFIALGELYDYNQQVVFRHEATLSKPRRDRLRLLEATRAHCEPVFMLYSDPAQTAERILFSPGQAWDIEITDEYGVSHRISRVSDPGTINILLTEMEDKKLIIADGHHRYETALEYSRTHAPANVAGSERNSYVLPQPAYAEAAAMMAFVNMDSAGVVILPTHRVVHSLTGYSTAQFLQKAEACFHIEAMGETEGTAIQKKLIAAGREGTAFVVANADGRYLLRARPEEVAAALSPMPSSRHRLDVVQLHSLLLEQILGISPEALREQRNVRYVREANDALDQVARGEANLAFLMNPVSLNDVRKIAFAGETMPQKSTDFYPKLLSGLAIYAFD